MSLWSIAPPQPCLTTQEIHLWRSPLRPDSAQQLQALAQTLSADERERADRFKFEPDRQRFIMGRGILRSILAKYLDTAPGELQFLYNAYGKPELPAGDRLLHFNLSHAGEWALVAIAPAPVGVDLESLRPLSNLERLITHCLSPQEQHHLSNLSTPEKKLAFLQLWTCKEACIKAVGKGLSIPLAEVEVNSLKLYLDWMNLTRSPCPARATRQCDRWWLQLFSPGADHIAAVAIAEGSWNLKFWQ